MRSLVLVIGLLAIAACNDDFAKKEFLPTAPRKAATATPVAALKFDTTKASSLCRAAVRQSQRARIRLDQTPGDLPGRQKSRNLDALVSSACQ